MGYMFPAIPTGLSLHTWGATACTGMGIGHKAALQAAKGTRVKDLHPVADVKGPGDELVG